MSVNKYQKNILVLPEDDAIRQIANGFLLDPAVLVSQVQVLQVAGGWLKVRSDIADTYSQRMIKYPETHLVAVIDFDGNPDRATQIMSEIPPDFADRAFILGIESEAEDPRRAMNLSFEGIGKALADNCRRGLTDVWDQELLFANRSEVARMRERVYPFLFSPI